MIPNLKEKYLQTFETLRKIHKMPSLYDGKKFENGCLEEMNSFIENVVVFQLNQLIENYLSTDALKEFIGIFSVDCYIKSNGDTFTDDFSNPVFCFKTNAFKDKKLFEHCAESHYLSIDNFKPCKRNIKVTFSITF